MEKLTEKNTSTDTYLWYLLLTVVDIYRDYLTWELFSTILIE